MINSLLRYILLFAMLFSAQGTFALAQKSGYLPLHRLEVQPDSTNRLLFPTHDFMNQLCDPGRIDTILAYSKAYRQALLQQNIPLALTYSDSLIHYSQRIRIQKLTLLDTYREQAELLKAMQRDSDACDAYIRAIREQDTLMRQTETDAVRDMQTTYELDRLSLGQALLKARHHKAALTSLIVLLLVVLCTVSFFYISNRHTKRLQQELVQKIALAKASEEQKSAFIKSMCHEIRTPLNCITGFSELLCSGEITLDLDDQYHEIIQQSRNQLRYAFNDILDVAYLENLTGTLPRNYSNLTALCRTQLRTMRIKHPKPGVSFVSDIPNNDIGIYSNEKYLAVLIFELLGNALKFTDSGTIRLTCSTSGSDKIIISVTDTGCGITAEQRELAFERFTKFDTFRQGNGLGLYLCRLIVRNLGGQIGIDPEYTSGTRMVVTLPRK